MNHLLKVPTLILKSMIAEIPDRSQSENGKCLHCDGIFSEEKWIQYSPYRRRTHEKCACMEDIADCYVCVHIIFSFCR